MKLLHSPQVVSAAYDFPTTRKAGWVAESLIERPIAGVKIVEPRALEPGELDVHDPAYVEAVMSGEPLELAESQGFEWDPRLPESVLAMNRGMVAAALDALSNGIAGCLGSGFHHAKRQRGDGFCTFNGIALAAKRVLAAGASSVLIIDLKSAPLMSRSPRFPRKEKKRGEVNLTMEQTHAMYPSFREHPRSLTRRPAGGNRCLSATGPYGVR